MAVPPGVAICQESDGAQGADHRQRMLGCAFHPPIVAANGRVAEWAAINQGPLQKRPAPNLRRASIRAVGTFFQGAAPGRPTFQPGRNGDTLVSGGTAPPLTQGGP